MADLPALSIPSPPTPVMLYVGAGYDLSPLLVFAPGGPPYPIVPLSEQSNRHTEHPSPYGNDTYTSFLFVDAKPRYTSAYMLADFPEWTTIEARVRNILYYAQGALSRWRSVPGAPDLLWFEGGGDPSLVNSRSRDPAWVFPSPALPCSSVASSTFSQSSPQSTPRPQPLTTLLYLFNTLDLELVHAPLLEHVWPRVEALYVHGLRLHVRTGAGMDFGRHMIDPSTHSGIDAVGSLYSADRRSEVELHISRIRLRTGLKKCYAIVGSWGTPARRCRSRRCKSSRAETQDVGVRHVDFVRDARSRWKVESRMRSIGRARGSGNADLCASLPASTPTSKLPGSSTPLISLTPYVRTISSSSHFRQGRSTSPSILRRPRVRRPVLHPGYGRESDYDGDSEDAYSDSVESDYGHSDEEDHDAVCMAELSSSSSMLGPFHVRIPQLAWSSTLHGGRGGYFVAKTVEESVAMWRSRRGASSRGSEGDESTSVDESDFEEGREMNSMVQKRKPVQYRYGLKSSFSIRARMTPAPAAVKPTHIRTSSIPHSRQHQPPRLRPRPPTPAPHSQETGSENSSRESLLGLGHCGCDGMGEMLEYECELAMEGMSGTTNKTGMKGEKEGIISGFWRRGMHAVRVAQIIKGRPSDKRGKAVAGGRTSSISPHICLDATHGSMRSSFSVVKNRAAGALTPFPSWGSRGLTSKSPDAPSQLPRKSPPSTKSSARERRIDIATFLSTSSEPDAFDMVEGVLSNAPVPSSVSNLVPVTIAHDAAQESYPLNSPSAISNFYPTPTASALPCSSSSVSFFRSHAGLSVKYPRSPYIASGIHNNVQVKQKQGQESSKKRRILLLAFGVKAKQQHEKAFGTKPPITRARSFSGLLRWNTLMACDGDGLSDCGLPPRSIRSHIPHTTSLGKGTESLIDTSWRE